MPKSKFAHHNVNRLFQHDFARHEQAAFKRRHENHHQNRYRHHKFYRCNSALIAPSAQKAFANPFHWVNLSWLMLVAMVRNASLIVVGEDMKKYEAPDEHCEIICCPKVGASKAMP